MKFNDTLKNETLMFDIWTCSLTEFVLFPRNSRCCL